MEKSGKASVMILIIVTIVAIASNIDHSDKTKDKWKNSDGSDIVCRVTYCGNRPVHSNWDDRFCSEHLYRSKNYSHITSNSDADKPTKRINTTPALSIEEAEALRGTGYHNTRPNSSAEEIAIKAAMVKCKVCGMHSDNGANSLCDECQYNKEFGLD